MVAGICVAISDEVSSISTSCFAALRMDTDPEYDDFELYSRIHELMEAYIHSPENDVDTSMLMTASRPASST